MSQVSIRNLRKQFGDHAAVADFSLEIDSGELIAFLGPSGCGKTTTLRMVAGFIPPTSGDILVNGRSIAHLPPHRRNTGMVFQRYALFPHMTVAENVAFGLEMRKVPAPELETRVRQALDMVRLISLRDRYPRQLSGGQQQRVALARALAVRPDIFLLDEPLSNLDAKLRVEVREEIRALQRELGLTTIFVTHDQEEAMTISDRMAVMHDGVVQQIGTPSELYERPGNQFVAQFMGSMNFLEGRMEAGRFVVAGGLTLEAPQADPGSSFMGIRPERIRLQADALPGQASAPVQVASVTYKGPVLEVLTVATSGARFLVHVPNTDAAELQDLRPGASFLANFNGGDCHFFNERGVS